MGSRIMKFGQNGDAIKLHLEGKRRQPSNRKKAINRLLHHQLRKMFKC
uniref:Uncharacterized protein n=1 Tax=Arundo donax TaxID=35708 RepID=A0A0A9D4Q4_ARUDO